MLRVAEGTRESGIGRRWELERALVAREVCEGYIDVDHTEALNIWSGHSQYYNGVMRHVSNAIVLSKPCAPRTV